ncbi:MAG TPA: diguanylate cyclase [Gemmatimonadota bacterium]|nr:diguanylate cyclase [Gemmatimonadota bacterium]
MTLLTLRLCIAAATGSLLWRFAADRAGEPLLLGPWIAYVVTTVGYAALPAPRFVHPRFNPVFLGIDLVILGTLFMAWGGFVTDVFTPLFLLTVLLAGLARSFPWALLMGASVAVVQAVMHPPAGAEEAGALALQALILMTSSGVVGFLSEEIERESAVSSLLDNALQISALVAEALDAETVCRRLTEMVARLFRAGRVAVILARAEDDRGRVVAAIESGRPVEPGEVALNEVPEVRQALRSLEPVTATATLAVPILDGGRACGSLFIRLEDPRRDFGEHEIRFCRLLADVAGRALQRADHLARVSEAARRDPLTGLFNVRVLNEGIEEEIHRAERTGASLSLLMIDVDFLKHVNDVYGHPAGDQVLKSLAETLRRLIRRIDLVARCGGEEFAVLLPETTAERGEDVAARLRESIEALEHPGVGEAITVSIGVAAYPEDAGSASELVHAADQALYVSKNSGRNRVTRYGTERVVLRHPAWRGGPPGHADPVAAELREAMTDLLGQAEMARNFGALSSLATALQTRDPRALARMRAAGRVARMFLTRVPVAELQRWTVEAACLFREVGRLASDRPIRSRPGPEPWDEVTGHGVTGARMLAGLTGLGRVMGLVRHHQERWDGTGDPDRLRGEAIPYGARIVAIVDGFLTALPDGGSGPDRLKEGASVVRHGAGTRFDPDLADRFLRMIEDERDAFLDVVDGLDETGLEARNRRRSGSR